ncbi:hypothetical protein TNCV_18381 [Trichonephila clavipes]|nr:hypothetical protein TNCV_18381 [Trichonephila clavipes]
MTVDLAQFITNFDAKHSGAVQGSLTSLSLAPASRKDLLCSMNIHRGSYHKVLLIYKHPCLLLDSSPASMAQPSTSLTAILDEWYLG